MDAQQENLEKLEKIMARADFWKKTQEEITKISQERALIKETIDQWNQYYQEAEDAKLLTEMAREEGDEPLEACNCRDESVNSIPQSP